MTVIGYARVSTSDQDTAIQVEQLKAAGCTKIYRENRTGTTTDGRTELKACLEYMREGDVLTITRLDRLARNARDLQNLVHDLEKRGIGLHVLAQGIDTRSPTSKAFMGMLAVFAEFETNIRKERQLEGIAKAKAEGVYKGRAPSARNQTASIKAMLAEGVSKPQVAKALNISISSIYNVVRKEKDAQQ